MIIRTFRGMLIVLLGFVFTSCTGEETIDQEYLQSQQYREFKENQEQEYARYIDDHRALETFLSAFGKCPLENQWGYPLEIDKRILSQDRPRCQEVAQKYKAHFSAHPIGYSVLGDVTIRWIKVDKQTGYKDIDLLAATYKDASLISFKTVGLFQENLSKNISTKITVENNGDYLIIHSLMNRGIKYPFEYDNVIQSTFKIDRLGAIMEQADKVSADHQVPQYLKALNDCEMGKRWTLPMTIKADVLQDSGIECNEASRDINKTVSSLGYSTFKDLTIRWFGAEEATSNGSILMAAIYRDNILTSFQTTGAIWQSSSRGISASAKVYQQGKFVYITSSVTKSKDQPIREESKKVTRYRIDEQGSISQL